MMPQPRVSIVMAVYNGDRYLRDALNSVLAQTFTDWEMVVVDDGSTDETPPILDDYAKCDSRFRIIHQANEGQTGALNQGLRAVRGQYIGRLDADDMMLPDRLEHQVRFLETHPQVAVVGSNVQLIDDTSRIYCTLLLPTDDSEIRRILIRGNPLVHSAVMFRRKILETVGLYDPAIQPGQDYDYWMRVSHDYAIVNLPQPLTQLRKHPSNMSRTQRRRQAKETLAVQMRAVALKWYPWWCMIFAAKSLFHIFAPDFTYALMLKYRKWYYRGTVRNRL